MTGPYGDAFDAYWHAGWRGILPLPARAKKNPPKGYTGESGTWPSYPDIHAWGTGPEGDGNIALRMPHNILGVDVDNYDGKPGKATLEDAEQRWGALPATWRTTSRDDGVSGIRLYRVPEGLAWPGELGDGTELIQFRHRYAIVWPSIHPEGRTYRWITPEGVTSTTIPDPDALPALPDTWVDGLTAGHVAEDVTRNSYTGTQTRQWLLTRPGSTDQPCNRMRRAIDATLDELAGGGSAHCAARDGALRVIRLSDEGHAGAAGALSEIHAAFTTNVVNPARTGEVRGHAAAEKEWADLVTSAVNLVTANPTGIDTCDCAGALTGLIVGGGYPVSGTAALAPLPPQQEPAETQPGTGNQTEPAERSRTSWWPRDVATILAGHDDEPAPSHLTRGDDTRLFYRGKVNALLGESESGKTWVAILAVHQALAAGEHVVYLDFEDTPAGIIGRCRALGTPDTDLTRLAYIGPDETLHAAAGDDLRETLDTAHPDLIILDGWNAAMTLLGLDLDKNKDATTFAQLLLKPLAASGACVVAVDHLPKNRENRGKGGIGAQAKRAMVTGCSLVADVAQPFGRGMTGRLWLTVDKDRAGHVRAHSAAAKTAGMAVLDSDGDTGAVTVRINPPDMTSAQQQTDARQLELMEKVSQWLIANGPASQTKIVEGVGRKKADVVTALSTLAERGFIEVEPGSRRAQNHRLVREFWVADDLTTPPGPTGSESVPGRSGEGPETSGSVGPPLVEGDPLTLPVPERQTQYTDDGTLIDTETGEIIDETGSGS